MDLFDHKVLTIHQIYELHFENPRRARRRMLQLHELGLVFRFRPHREKGSYPYHYVVGKTGLELVAAERDIDDKKLRIRYDRITKLALSQRLHHQIEVNSFFTRLSFACRTTPELVVREWWNEERCIKAFQRYVRPDALGMVQSSGALIRFFLEVDRGTENSSRLTEKRIDYSYLADFKEDPRLVLFTFPSLRRERFARQFIYVPGMTVGDDNPGLGSRAPA